MINIGKVTLLDVSKQWNQSIKSLSGLEGGLKLVFNFKGYAIGNENSITILWCHLPIHFREQWWSMAFIKGDSIQGAVAAESSVGGSGGGTNGWLPWIIVAIAGLALVTPCTLIHSLENSLRSRGNSVACIFLKRIGDERVQQIGAMVPTAMGTASASPPRLSDESPECEDSSGDQVLLINSPHCANSTRQQ
ncbi:hypothetical protein C5167_012850 [Papaver somniferum]|uniref:Uncharacterized protein n=1 Tax=Papaver somniferum TaxID=3469 RepID=A0A4Y7IYM2_PAPSO|nr:hypothetical protein C5167_012850 [Papaver somniferum]